MRGPGSRRRPVPPLAAGVWALAAWVSATPSPSKHVQVQLVSEVESIRPGQPLHRPERAQEDLLPRHLGLRVVAREGHVGQLSHRAGERAVGLEPQVFDTEGGSAGLLTWTLVSLT